MREPDVYKEVKTFQYGNITARVHIPDLTAEEYERRRARLEVAARELLLSRYEKKPEK